MWKYFYNTNGEIIQYAQTSMGAEPIVVGLECYESESPIDTKTHKIDVNTKLPVPFTPTPVAPREHNWNTKRSYAYGTAEQQLGLLYHDIKDGVFGEAAKDGAWFKHIVQIKENFPKG